MHKPNIWAHFLKKTFMDAFSSNDLVHWQKHNHVLDVKNVAWAAYALPSAIDRCISSLTAIFGRW